MKKLLLFLAAMSLFSVSAVGQIGNTQMYFNGGYQGDVWGGGPEGTVATGFYDGSINGVNVGPGQTSPGFICDDYYDTVFPGEHWTATQYQVSALNASNIGAVLFGNSNWSAVVNGWTAVQGYQALAYLANYMFTQGVGHSGLQSSISQALWYLTSLASGHGFSLAGLDAGAQGLVAYVKSANLPGLNTYAGLFLYSQPFNPTGPQEMWGQVGTFSLPEGGATLLYLMLAAMACLLALRQRHNRKGASA